MKILLQLFRKLKISKKITFVSLYLIFFLIGDIFFSNFVYKKDIKHNCYKYLKDYYGLTPKKILEVVEKKLNEQ